MADPEKLGKLKEDLEKACKAQKFSKILKKANEILALEPEDDDGKRCKCVALAKLDRCKEGLAFCGDDEALQDVKAYCQYRLGDLDGALTSSDGNEEAVAHVKAQTLYRQGQYAEASEVYASLLFEEREDGFKRSAADRRELEANYYAACALAGKGREAVSRLKPPDDPEQHHELAYNRGCCEAQCGDLASTKTLEQALNGALKVAEEDVASIQDRTDETATYAAQLAYALEQSGDSSGAVERAKALLKAKPSDDAIKFAATCTLVAARKDVVDLFDSHKRLKAYAQQDFASLSPKHAALGRLLWARTLLAMGKVPDAQQALEKPFEDCEDQCDAELLLAAHAQPEKKKKKKKKGDEETKEEAAEALIPAIVQAMASVAKKGVDDYKLRLALAQAHHDCGRHAEAEEALAGSSLAEKPAIMATRAELLNKAGSRDKAVELLRTVDVQPDDNALRVAAQRLKFDDVEGCKAAVAIYPGTTNEDVAKKAILAAFYDADEAEESVNQLPQDLLPQMDEEMTQEEVDKLIEAGVPKEWRTSRREDLQKTLNVTASTPEELEEAKAKKRAAVWKRRTKRREVYLAKLEAEGKYDPKRPKLPDPERWIPKKQRSYNKRGRKNKGKFTGAQGGDIGSKDALKLDAKSRADERKAKDLMEKAARDEDIASGMSGKKKRTGNRRKKGN